MVVHYRQQVKEGRFMNMMMSEDEEGTTSMGWMEERVGVAHEVQGMRKSECQAIAPSRHKSTTGFLRRIVCLWAPYPSRSGHCELRARGAPKSEPSAANQPQELDWGSSGGRVSASRRISQTLETARAEMSRYGDLADSLEKVPSQPVDYVLQVTMFTVLATTGCDRSLSLVWVRGLVASPALDMDVSSYL